MDIRIIAIFLVLLLGLSRCGDPEEKNAKIIDPGTKVLDPGESLRYIDNLLEDDPDSWELILKKAEILYALKQYDQSYETLTMIEDPPEDPRYLILEIELNLMKDSIDKALETAERLYNSNAVESIDLNEQMAFLYAEKKDFLKAIDHINYCLDKNPGDPKYSYLKGLYYFNFKDTVNAYQYIEKALDNGYEEMNGIVLYTDLLLASNKPDEALELVENSLTVEPDNTELKNALARIYNLKQMYDISKEISFALVDSDTVNSAGFGPYLNLADVYLDTREYDSAIFYAEKALQIDDQINEGYYILGKAHRAKEQVYNAYNAYSKVLEYDQGDPYALSEMQKLENYIAYLQRIRREYESRPVVPVLKPKSIEQ